MKLKEYLEHLNKLASEKPEVLDYVVVYAKDNEGNGFQIVNYKPDVGHFDSDYSGYFRSEDNLEEDETSNSICIN
jgi:hypothetical protein